MTNKERTLVTTVACSCGADPTLRWHHVEHRTRLAGARAAPGSQVSHQHNSLSASGTDANIRGEARKIQPDIDCGPGAGRSQQAGSCGITHSALHAMRVSSWRPSQWLQQGGVNPAYSGHYGDRPWQTAERLRNESGRVKISRPALQFAVSHSSPLGTV